MILDVQQYRRTPSQLIKGRSIVKTTQPHPFSFTQARQTTQLSLSKFELQDIPIPADDVLSPKDLFDGVLIALALAFVATALQGRRNQTDFYLPDISGSKASGDEKFGTNETENRIIFDSESWEEISQPDNYILYNQKLKARKNSSSTVRTEKKWVIIALLIFFVPIFSVEFFFALSRQLVCDGDIMNRPEWAEYLCSPVNL